MNDKITKNDIVRSFKNMREIMRIVNEDLTYESQANNPHQFLGALEDLANELVAEANVLAEYVIQKKFDLYQEDVEILKEEAEVLSRLNK